MTSTVASSVMTNIITILTSGITQIATGIGTGLKNLIENLFLVTTGTGDSAVTTLSTFGTIVVIFAGISLALGLCRGVINWIQSLGSTTV